jgi:hypothetical protein
LSIPYIAQSSPSKITFQEANAIRIRVDGCTAFRLVDGHLVGTSISGRRDSYSVSFLIVAGKWVESANLHEIGLLEKMLEERRAAIKDR